MYTVSDFRNNVSVSYFFSLLVGTPASKLAERLSEFHGNTKLFTVIKNTEGQRHSIYVMTHEDIELMKVSCLREAAEQIAEIEEICNCSIDELIHQIKRKRNSTLIARIFPQLIGSEFSECNKFDFLNFLNEYIYWRDILIEVLSERSFYCARQLHNYLMRPRIRQISTVGDIIQLDSEFYDLDVSVLESVIKGLNKSTDNFIVEWLSNYNGFTHFNAFTHREYTHFYSWFMLSIISGFFKYKFNLWATKSAWLKHGYLLNDKAKMGFVFHKFAVLESSESEYVDEKQITSFGRKISIVYNVDEVHGVGTKVHSGTKKFDEQWFWEGLKELNVEINYSEVERAYYSLSDDCICMPDRRLFQMNKHGRNSFFATLLHELVHWTGHESRCKRDFSSNDYARAFEELIAELGAAFLCSRFGITRTPRKESIQYIANWLNSFEENEWIKILEKAAIAANKASNYIYSSFPPKR